MRKWLFAPDGTRITSTVECVPGTCDLNDAMPVTQNPDGTYDFHHDDGTEIDWDGQETATRDGQRVFLDEDGGEWLENELVLRDVDED